MALFTCVMALGTFARISVLLLESLAVVRDERHRDTELLDLCRSGAARESEKMRVACLHAQSDRASPILLKAVLRAFSTAFDDFSASVSSPAKLLVVVLFCLTSVFLPLNSVLRAFTASEIVEGKQHVVVVAGDGFGQNRQSGSRFRRAFGALKMRRRPQSLTFNDDHNDCLIEIGGENGMVDIPLRKKQE